MEEMVFNNIIQHYNASQCLLLNYFLYEKCTFSYG